MNQKRILEAVVAGVAVWLVVEWVKKKQATGAQPASFVPGSPTQSNQGVMA